MADAVLYRIGKKVHRYSQQLARWSHLEFFMLYGNHCGVTGHKQSNLQQPLLATRVPWKYFAGQVFTNGRAMPEGQRRLSGPPANVRCPDGQWLAVVDRLHVSQRPPPPGPHHVRPMSALSC